jgi:hypothetical protein
MGRRLAGAAVVALCALALAPPATAAGTPLPEAPMSGRNHTASELDSEAASFARERGISTATAAQRLGWQLVAPDLAERVANDLGGRSGGVWVDVNDGDRIKIGIVGGSDPQTDSIARRAAEAVGLFEGYDLVEVRHSADELERHNAWLGAEIARVNVGAAATLTAGLRTDLNAIELQTPVHGTLTAAQVAMLAEAAGRLGDRLVLASYLGQPQAWAGCAYPYCDPPLRGGIRINGNIHPCTGGFVARSKVDDKLYQFTAGHCMDGGDNDSWSTRFTDDSVHVIGPLWHWKWHGAGDMAIVRINNVPGWNPKGWVHVTSGPDTTSDTTYHISSDNFSVIGMRICSTGSYYGRSDCGYVTHLGVTVTYEGVTVHNLGRSSACGTNGDSGAPMYALHVAHGILLGGYSECQSFYQGIRAAEEALNVDVVHALS